MDSSQKLDPRRLKSFVRNVCIIAKKHKDREEARSDLQRQIQRLKKFSSKKKEMDTELEELNNKMTMVLETERRLLGAQQGESSASKELMRNVMDNRERIAQINASINGISRRLNDYINIKTARERRINELESKIRAKTKKRENISLLRDKLRELEATSRSLKNKGADVSRIEGKINDIKLRLA